MPTDKPSRRLYYSEEELRDLRTIFDELIKVGRRGRPEYLGQNAKFNTWLKGLTAEGAARARQVLAGGAAAPMSGTVRETMAKTPPTKKTPDSPEATATPGKRGRKAGSGKMTSITLSLETWVVDWLREQDGGPSPAANSILVRSLRKRRVSR